ncbi:MAG TPA: type VI secretion system tip protein VgrG, partial [Polyangiaceae bacterium]|nr:type VI secretion system tip protein VgrG [Polyangiaceae bacterium]
MACNSSPHVLRVSGRETMSDAYLYRVEMEVVDIDRDAAMGEPVYLRLTDECARERHVHGVVERLEFSATRSRDAFRVTLELRPPQYLLHYRRGFRIFQEMSVPDIVQKVFESAGLPAEVFRWELQSDYEEREYCVQYNESEWDFVCRLLEDEGIYFAFEHALDSVVMVIGDTSEGVESVPGETLRFVYGAGGLDLGGEYVTDWITSRRVSENKVSLNDYDGLNP